MDSPSTSDLRLCGTIARETRHTVGILREYFRQDLNRDVAPELSIRCAPNLAHAAFAELGRDAVMRDALLRHYGVISGIVSPLSAAAEIIIDRPLYRPSHQQLAARKAFDSPRHCGCIVPIMQA